MDNDVAAFGVELATGSDINTPGPEDMTPLHIAADRGNVDFAKALLDNGANIDPINVWGNTPLWMAIMKQSRTCPDGSMIRLLLTAAPTPTAVRMRAHRSSRRSCSRLPRGPGRPARAEGQVTPFSSLRNFRGVPAGNISGRDGTGTPLSNRIHRRSFAFPCSSHTQ
ncbi:ankyrin repeat domain-containing protein [Mycolicibacterium conceptionense]|uniref:ankyrin repeat domain-containing protein n=1 Tax=Mycolicibacterium conceptionense TaxID=451644 RepID=UPI001F2EA044|nr:ankyrin repeat domain-containing protein [Mycolicibacterium conceptionense]